MLFCAFDFSQRPQALLCSALSSFWMCRTSTFTGLLYIMSNPWVAFLTNTWSISTLEKVLLGKLWTQRVNMHRTLRSEGSFIQRTPRNVSEMDRPRWTGRESNRNSTQNRLSTAVGCGFDCFIMKPTLHKLSILTKIFNCLETYTWITRFLVVNARLWIISPTTTNWPERTSEATNPCCCSQSMRIHGVFEFGCIYSVSKNHGSGKWTPWRLNSSSMIMGGRVWGGLCQSLSSFIFENVYP